MPRSNPAVISISEVAQRLGESVSTTYYRATTTGYVYPGVEAKRIDGIDRWFVSRADFDRAVGTQTPLKLDQVPVDWWDR
jgi:hypothetical protein